MPEKGNADHHPVKSNVAISLTGAFLALATLAVGPAGAADNGVKLLLTAAEIVAESPAAVQKLVGVYSEIPGFPAGGKQVKLYVFRGTDLVCTLPLKGTQKDRFACWHFGDAPEPIQKLVNEKDAEFAEK